MQYIVEESSRGQFEGSQLPRKRADEGRNCIYCVESNVKKAVSDNCEGCGR